MNVRKLTRTAILLALTIVFQYLGRYIPLGPNSNFVVGPLVNACLFIAAAAVGLGGGAAIAVIAPVIAVLTNRTPTVAFLLYFTPFIAAGNFVLVLSFSLFMKKNKAIGVIGGAILKFVLLYGGITFMTGLMKVGAKPAALLTFMFGWPQLVTAFIGGIIALLVIKALERNIEL